MFFAHLVEIWTPEALKARFAYGMYCENPTPRRFFVMDFGFDFCCFLEALTAVFPIFGSLETGLNIDAFLVV